MFNKQPKVVPNPRMVQTNRINGAKGALLLIVVFTVLNCVMAFTGSTSYFLFSAMIPYFLVLSGGLSTGKITMEGYIVDELAPMSILYVLLGAAIVLAAVYLICFFVARKRPFAGLLIGLVWFGFDTLAMFFLFGFSPDMLLDYGLHALAIVELVLGVMGAAALKKMPPEEPVPAPGTVPGPAASFDGYGVAPDFPVAPAEPAQAPESSEPNAAPESGEADSAEPSEDGSTN